MMENLVFGPVPSRRLGQSLGVDTIPAKTCNWNCVYCQLGRSIRLTRERAAYYPRQAVLEQVQSALQRLHPGEVDWITFVGSGEPTLHSDIGWLIRQVKAISSVPVAVITNGSLLYLPEVREELSAADAVLPSLDAGSEALYRRINRALPELTFERLLNGLIAFRQEYSGQLWVEVMLMDGLNDTPEQLQEIAAALHQIRPDQVHLNVPSRPPCEAWVKPSNSQAIERAVRIIGSAAQVVQPKSGRFDLQSGGSVEEAVLNIIRRHPMSEEQLREALAGQDLGQLQGVLDSLLKSGQAQAIERLGVRFWSAADAVYRNNR